MFSSSCLWASFAILASLASHVHALGKVTRSGKYLYAADGTRFYVKGVAYQQQGTVDASDGFVEPTSFIDPLADDAGCARDLPFLQQLGVNAVHVYSVNSSLNHDSCMIALSGAGIYAIIDLTLPVNGSIDRSQPLWTTGLLDQYITTINSFSKYDNVLAYGIGNEVIIGPDGTGVAPFIKASARDVRAYLNSVGSSALISYSAVDGPDWILSLAEYLSCDPSNNNGASTSIDLYGLNNYELCGNQTFDQAYATKTDWFSQLTVAAYFSEFGCVNPSPRVWADVSALFSSEAVPVWSGGVAFSYFPAVSSQGQFGLVNISGSTVTTGTDFANLKTAYSQVQFTNSPTQSSAPAATYNSCPANNATWLASNTLPPTPNDAACKCLDQNLSCLFTPQVSNTSVLVGELFNAACSLLGGAGSNCDAIGANGTTGVYGEAASCDADTTLSFVMTQWYELQNQNPMACSFSGNGTVNPAAASNVAAVNAAATSCLAAATGVSTPSAPAGSTPSPAPQSSGSSSSGTGNHSSASVRLTDSAHGLIGLLFVVAAGVIGGVLTLA